MSCMALAMGMMPNARADSSQSVKAAQIFKKGLEQHE